jgi:hypothetical protein
MDVILVLVGLEIVIWALYSLFSPPKKHKHFSLHDRDQATLGVGDTPDLSKLELEDKEKKEKEA